MPGTKGNKNARGTRFRPTETTSFLERLRLERLSTAPTARTHGAVTVRRELRELRAHALDPSTLAAAVYREAREELVASLGGAEALSTQQIWLLEEAAHLRLQLLYANTWLASQPELINHKTGAMLLAMTQKQSLVKSLAKLLELLGIQRREKDTLTLQDYLRERQSTDRPTRAAQPGTREGQEP